MNILNELGIKSCPKCGSRFLTLYKQDGVDLQSRFTTIYFLECNRCGAEIKSKDLERMVYIWNNTR